MNMNESVKTQGLAALGRDALPVWRHFENICGIPHGSGHEAALADYVEQFARARGLYVYRDHVNNVLIKCPATAGMADAPAVMLQGHLDMVCEKDADSAHDFATDPLRLFLEDGWLAAEGTTLGGDDGIAVAMMLAIMEDPGCAHPPLECLFTVSEETGLEGAHAFDPAAAGVTAGRMINLDSEAEGVLTAGCAGGMRTDITVPVHAVSAAGTLVKVSLSGLSGGHSGVEINEGHTNAIKALGRWLDTVWNGAWTLVSLSGGGKDNAIPRDAEATLAAADNAAAEKLCADLRAAAASLRGEPQIIAADRDFAFSAEVIRGAMPGTAMDVESSRRVLDTLVLARDGVLAMSAHKAGLVAYSRNLGIASTVADGAGNPTAVRLAFSTRSASESHLDDATRELSLLAATVAHTVAIHTARYPGWDYAPSSPLRDQWTQAAERLYGVTPVVEVVHAGLECGILASKMPGLDMISVGPDMRDIHTPRERLSVASVGRTYRLLCAVVGAADGF